MKIREIEIDRTSPLTAESSKQGCFRLAFLHTPAVVTIGSGSYRTEPRTTVLCRFSTEFGISAIEGKMLLFDIVNYHMSSSEFQLLDELSINVDEPICLAGDMIIRNLLRSVQLQTFRSENRRDEFADSALRMIFLCMSEQCSEKMNGVNTDVPHYHELSTLRERIFAEPVREWTINEICNEMNISHTYFHRIYFSAFGTTCRQDVITSRLMYAEKLLVSTDKSISSVAEICGYDSDSYFMRQFKKFVGCTPSEYRNNYSSVPVNNQLGTRSLPDFAKKD